jgi:hypothetical protein
LDGPHSFPPLAAPPEVTVVVVVVVVVVVDEQWAIFIAESGAITIVALRMA